MLELQAQVMANGGGGGGGGARKLGQSASPSGEKGAGGVSLFSSGVDKGKKEWNKKMKDYQEELQRRRDEVVVDRRLEMAWMRLSPYYLFLFVVFTHLDIVLLIIQSAYLFPFVDYYSMYCVQSELYHLMRS